jgi:enoyl-CoA hydratase/3-hydroxyacyl-CoA dehydrogenase
MEANDIQTIAVLGAGSMGHGIAEVASLAGYNVNLRDISEEYVQEGYDQIEWSIQKLTESDQLSKDEANGVLDRLETYVALDDALGDVDLVIEAVPEKMEIKSQVYEEATTHAPDRAVFASNTSTLSITDLSEVTDREAQFCGMHFFNPPVHMPLVEVIAGAHTSEETLTLAEDVATTMEKTPIRVRKDVPGFVVNRVLVPMLNEAAWLVETTEATIEEVDSTAKFDLGLPMGCFELTDQIGIDVIVDVIDYMHETLGDGYKPCPLLTEMAEKGDLGKKTGSGFYDYSEEELEIPADAGRADIERRIVGTGVNESSKLVVSDVSTPSEIDEGLKLGANFPKGPIQMGSEIGYERLHDELETAYEQTNDSRYQPTELLKTWADEGRLK